MEHLAGLDANLLIALDALLAEQHVGRAARRLGLSESATSHALARARRHFDDPLLVRVGRKMTLSDRARRMAPSLRAGLELVASAVTTPATLDLGEVRRVVRIAATDFAHSVLGPVLWRAVSQAAPGVDLVFSPANAVALDLLRQGELDVVLTRDRRAKGLRYELLLEEAFVSMVRRGHPVLAGRITAKRFASLGHVVVNPGLRKRGAVDAALGKRNLRRRVAYVSPTFLGAARVVAQSDLVLTGSRRNAEEVAEPLGLATFEPPVKLTPFRQAMYWRPSDEHDLFLSWVRDRIRDAAA
ncbi:MAG: LysR family transcriptional regulator [Myxococcales bacterium]|nr:LysR family transcriptional regulator [Myxococcales bacterium]